MSHTEMMEVASEISDIAEESKQYNASRATTIDKKTGHLDWREEGMKPGQQASVVYGELSKSEARRKLAICLGGIMWLRGLMSME